MIRLLWLVSMLGLAVLGARTVLAQEAPAPLVPEVLPAGTVVVEVRDSSGHPLPGKEVTAAIRTSLGKFEERRVVSAKSGDCWFEGLPTDVKHQVSFRLENDGLVLAQTAPMHLSTQTGQRVEIRPLELTDSLAKVSISSYRAIFSKDHGRVDVTLHLVLVAPGSVVFRAAAGYCLPLPDGAIAPFIPDEEAKEHFRVEAQAVCALDPITSEETELAVSFKMNVSDGRLNYEHRLGRPVAMAQLISSWTQEPASLSGEGMPPPDLRELNSGLLALITMTHKVESGVIRATLSGLEAGASQALRLGALLACSVLFLLGIGLWIRDRRTSSAP